MAPLIYPRGLCPSGGCRPVFPIKICKCPLSNMETQSVCGKDLRDSATGLITSLNATGVSEAVMKARHVGLCEVEKRHFESARGPA